MQRTMRLLGALTAALALAAAGALPAYAETPVEPQPGVQAGVGDLKVIQVATTDPGKLMDEWATPGEGVQLTSLGARTIQGKPIIVFIIFQGCRTDAAGNCNLTADYETLAPDGKIIGVVKGLPLLVGEAPLGGGQFQLCPAGYLMTADAKGPFGIYRVRATVTDHVAGVSVTTDQPLEIDAQ